MLSMWEHIAALGLVTKSTGMVWAVPGKGLTPPCSDDGFRCLHSLRYSEHKGVLELPLHLRCKVSTNGSSVCI